MSTFKMNHAELVSLHISRGLTRCSISQCRQWWRNQATPRRLELYSMCQPSQYHWMINPWLVPQSTPPSWTYCFGFIIIELPSQMWVACIVQSSCQKASVIYAGLCEEDTQARLWETVAWHESPSEPSPHHLQLIVCSILSNTMWSITHHGCSVCILSRHLVSCGVAHSLAMRVPKSLKLSDIIAS